MGEVLHVVDFDQLKIENQQYLDRIEERNTELLRLKATTGKAVQVYPAFMTNSTMPIIIKHAQCFAMPADVLLHLKDYSKFCMLVSVSRPVLVPASMRETKHACVRSQIHDIWWGSPFRRPMEQAISKVRRLRCLLTGAC